MFDKLAYARDYYRRHAVKLHEQFRQAYARNPGAYWAANIRRKYGLTVEAYDRLSARQRGCCAICGERPKQRLGIDHNHVTGEVRGLLCNHCNVRVGFIETKPTAFEQTVTYCTKHGILNPKSSSQRPKVPAKTAQKA